MPDPDRTLHQQMLPLTTRERAELEALRAAARKFLAKVERGEARSLVTYAEMKAALQIGE